MSVVSEIITQDQIQDLWGCGFTIVSRKRHVDPFFVPPDMVPQGRSYQWWHLVHDQPYFRGVDTGWAAVPASRHDGYFMPFGHVGDIEVNGLGLFEKPKFEVDAERAQQIKDAEKPLQDWAAKYGGQFTGGARMLDGDSVTEIDTTGLLRKSKANFEAPPDRGLYGDTKTKTLDTTVAIPRDMTPHMATIFAERDRLKDEIVLPDRSLKPGEIADKFYAAVDADKSLAWWPTLHAILLPIAIDNVRKSLKQEDKS